MSSGLLSKVAVVQGSTWGTAVALTTNHRVPFKSCTVQHMMEHIRDDSITGKATRALPGSGGNKRSDGALVVQSDYRQHGILIAAALGAAVAPATSDTSAKTHALPFSDDVYGKFVTLGHDAGSKRVEIFKSLKVNRHRFEARTGAAAEDTFDFLGRGMDDTGASSGWTYATDPSGGGGRPIYLGQSVIRVNAQSGGALGSGDTVYPTRFAYELRRNLGQDYAQADEPEEPLPGGHAEIDVEMDFFALTTALVDLFREAYQNKTALKMSAVFTSPMLAGAATVYHARKFYCPSLFVTDAPVTTPGAGPVPCSVRFSAHHASSLPTGFPTGYDEAATIEIVDTSSQLLS